MRCCVNVVCLRILSRHIQLPRMRKHVALLTDFACALLSPPTERSELEEIMRLVDLSVVVLCVSSLSACVQDLVEICTLTSAF